MFKTLKLLAALSPAERRTIRSGQFAGDFTPEALLDQMRTLARFDASNDAAREDLKKLMGFFVLVTIVSAILGLYHWVPPVTFSIAGIGVLGAGICSVLNSRLTGVDICNNFRDVALPFLAVLKQDMEADQMLAVRIDLRSPTHERKRHGSVQPPLHGAYTKIVDSNFRDAWFHGSARLADGSVLRWDVSEDICESKRTKRSASRKLKTKTRHYKRSTVAIALAVPNKSYGVNRGLSSSRHKVAVADGAKRHVIKLTRKLKSKSLDPLDPRILIEAVSSAYKRVVAPTRSAA